MIRRHPAVLVMTAAMTLLSVVVRNAWGQVQYAVTDLGTLPGSTSSFANGINASGQVVGETGPGDAFLYCNGTMTDLGTLPGGSESSAYGINDNGQVVGCAATSTDGESCHAFLYSNRRMTDLGALPGCLDSCANGINATGQIVGYASTSTGSDHAFLYSNGTMTDLSTLAGGSDSRAYGINDSGQVVGYATSSSGSSYAFLYSNGKMTDLGAPPGGVASIAAGINAGGQVVGWSLTSTALGEDAFLYSNGKATDLGTLGTEDSVADCINNSGQVVGAIGLGDAFLYSNGTMTDLNSLIPASSGFYLEAATGINDSGQICGWGLNSARRMDAFLLTPVNPGQVIASDPVVDINDLTIVLTNFGKTGCTWSQGCMDGDPAGTVDVNDLTIVLANFGTTYGASPGMTAVPEPSCVLLVGAAVLGLAACACRRRR